MESPEAGVYPYLFKEQMEKNAVLINVLQIAFDALQGLAKEEDPAKIKELAQVTCAAMTKTLETKVPPKLVKASQPEDLDLPSSSDHSSTSVLE